MAASDGASMGSEPGDTGWMSPDEICLHLSSSVDTDLVGAIMSCREQREIMTPLLLQWFRQSLDELREPADDLLPDELPFHVLYVLAEFDVREALPLVVEGLRLPGDAPDDFFGDALNSLVARVLAAWDTEELQHVSEIMGDRSLSFTARSIGTDAYCYRVRDGRMSRQEAIERIREYLQECLSQSDADGVTSAVFALCTLGPRAADAEIEEAFRQDLVDVAAVTRLVWYEGREREDSVFDEKIAALPSSRIDDAAEELVEFYGLDEEDDEYVPAGSDEDDWLYDGPDVLEPELFEPEIPAAPSVTIRNEVPKVGRNDPCPCGSGKKYKKCCGRAG